MVQGCLGGMGKARRPYAFWERGASPAGGMAGPVGPVPTQGSGQTQRQGQDQRGQGVEHLLPCQGEEQSGQSSQGGGYGQGRGRRGFFMVGTSFLRG